MNILGHTYFAYLALRGSRIPQYYYHYVAQDAREPTPEGSRARLAALLTHCRECVPHYAAVLRNLPDPQRDPEGVLQRIIVEKPFGHDLESARHLNDALVSVFDESQVYRIDHYLGKETVQNLMVFRFANGLFEPVWNRNYIDRVEITAAEDIGIGSRAGYYDHAGALRVTASPSIFRRSRRWTSLSRACGSTRAFTRVRIWTSSTRTSTPSRCIRAWRWVPCIPMRGSQSTGIASAFTTISRAMTP